MCMVLIMGSLNVVEVLKIKLPCMIFLNCRITPETSKDTFQYIFRPHPSPVDFLSCVYKMNFSF